MEREYRIHRAKMDHCRPTTDFSKQPRQFEFLDAKISKNFKARFAGEKIEKANEQLLAKLPIAFGRLLAHAAPDLGQGSHDDFHRPFSMAA